MAAQFHNNPKTAMFLATAPEKRLANLIGRESTGAFGQVR
jgi:hypothetical protein